MKTTFLSMASAVILLVPFACGCKDNPQASAVAPSQAAATPPSFSRPSQVLSSEEEAIRQAVEDHVRNNKGINMSAMDMTVDSINVDGDQAQANATFRLKQGGTAMSMTYTLARHADGWLVLTNQPSGGQFVHPPMDKVHSGLGSPAAAPASNAMPDFTDLVKSKNTNKPR